MPDNASIKKSKPILEFIAPQTQKLGTNLLELWNSLTIIDDTLTDKGLLLNSCMDIPHSLSQHHMNT